MLELSTYAKSFWVRLTSVFIQQVKLILLTYSNRPIWIFWDLKLYQGPICQLILDIWSDMIPNITAICGAKCSALTCLRLDSEKKACSIPKWVWTTATRFSSLVA